ncbi:hypothetical protein [Streptomyces avidinii]
MAETYWRDGIDQKKAVFELFFRKKLPLTAVLPFLPVLKKRLNFCGISDLLKAI